MLISCERCKRHFSIREDACPFCKHGSAFARIGAAALSAGVLLSGCDAGKDNKDNKNTTQGSAAVAAHAWATVTGTVKSKDGRSLDAAVVNISSTAQIANKSFQKGVPTDANGTFTLDLLEPGPYMLNVNYADFTHGTNMNGYDTRQLALKAGDEVKLEIVLELRDMGTAMPYGAPPARRRTV